MIKKKSLVWFCVILMIISNINVFSTSANAENDEKSLTASSIFDGKFLMKMDYEDLTAGSIVKVEMYVRNVTMAGVSGFFDYDKEIFYTPEKESIILSDYSSSTGNGDWSIRWNPDNGKIMITEDSGDQIAFKGTMLFATFKFILKKDLTDASTIAFSTVEIDGDDKYYESQYGINLTLLPELENNRKVLVTSLFDEKLLMKVDYDDLVAESVIKVDMYVKDVTMAGISGFFTYDREIFNGLEKKDIILPEYSSANSTGDWSIRWNVDNGKVMVTEDSGSQIAFRDTMLFATFRFTLKKDLEDITTITFSTVEIDGEDEYYENKDGINFAFPLKTGSGMVSPSISPVEPTPSDQPTKDPDESPNVSENPITTLTPSDQPTKDPDESPNVSESPITTLTPSDQPTKEPDESPNVSESPITTLMPSDQPTKEPDESPNVSESPITTLMPSEQPTKESGESPIPSGTATSSTNSSLLNKMSPTVGEHFIDSSKNAVYKITKLGMNNTAEYVVCKNKNAKNVSVPSVVRYKTKVYKVTSIGQNAFAMNKKLHKIVLGKNITSIKNKAFYKCKKLSVVKFNDKLKTIGEQVFQGCSNITLLTLPKNLQKIGDKSFYGCSKLQYIMIKSKMFTSSGIGKLSFAKCSKTVRVKTPKSKWRLYARIMITKGKISSKATFVI